MRNSNTASGKQRIRSVRLPAWHILSFGGDVLQVEVNHFEGKGKLVITGQLGDVMKRESQPYL